MDKHELQEKAKNWYLGRKSGIPQEVIDWAIGEEEFIHLSYLLEEWEEEVDEVDKEGELTHEKRLIVTENRVVKLKIFPNEASYETYFIISDIENIVQDFSVASQVTGPQLNPSYSVTIELEEQKLKLEPRSNPGTQDKEDFQELIEAITDLRFA